MPDEGLIGSLDLCRQLIKISLPVVTPIGQRRIQVSMRSMPMGQVISPLGSDRDFDPFNGVEDQQTQFPVENVEVQDLSKAGSGLELMGCVVGLEGKPVGTETVIVQVLEIELGRKRIVNLHAALLQKGDLLGESRGGFCEGARHWPPPEKE
jgi:hypothetical protein